MFVDIHTHILPGIDDGAPNSDTSLKMADTARQSGTGHLIATPHFIEDTISDFSDVVKRHCRNLNGLIKKEHEDLTIHPGCEVFIRPELPALFDSGCVLTLADSRYMLVELPMMSIPGYSEEILFSLQLRGIVPILAHPERYHYFQDRPELLESWVKRGILTQVNSGSLTGLFGKRVQKTSHQLIKRGLVHFIASDAHSNGRRSTNLSQAAEEICRLYGEKARDELFTHNGLKLLHNEPIETHSETFGKKKSRTFNQLKNLIHSVTGIKKKES